jgi:hypothetical protein
MLDDAQTNQSPRYLIKCKYQFMTQGRLLYTKEAADESRLADIKMFQPCWFNTMKTKLNLLWDNWSSNFFQLKRYPLTNLTLVSAPSSL